MAVLYVGGGLALRCLMGNQEEADTEGLLQDLGVDHFTPMIDVTNVEIEAIMHEIVTDTDVVDGAGMVLFL